MLQRQHHWRRRVVAVVGDGNLDMAIAEDARKHQIAEELGRCLVERGCRVQTGGLGGVMAAALAGAHSSAGYREGATIAILPGDDAAVANPWADIVICTGLGHYRNGIVARADGMIAVGGGAGTLQEVAMAWGAARPIVMMRGVAGCTAALAGQCIDERGPAPVGGADSAEQAVQLLLDALDAAGCV